MEHTIEIPLEEVHERWGKAVEPLVGENWSMESSDQVALLPYARIKPLGNPAREHDISGNEVATTLSFQVDTYEKGQKALSKVYKIDALSHEAMVSMGFRRTYGPELTENVDTKIKRLISRYSRVYTGDLLNE